MTVKQKLKRLRLFQKISKKYNKRKGTDFENAVFPDRYKFAYIHEKSLVCEKFNTIKDH